MLTSAAAPVPEPFTLREARGLGLTKNQLRSKRFVNPFHGVYAAANESDDLRARCAAAARILPAVAVFSHSTAAALWELPAPALSNAVEVSVPAGTTVPQILGIKAHERKALDARCDDDVSTVSGLRVTNAATLFIDLAERLDHMQLMALGDGMLRKQLVTRSVLEHAANRAARRRGIRLARRIASLLDPRAESPMESYLRALLIAAGLTALEVNPDLYDEYGSFLARVDLLFRKQRVIVEFDGDHHRTDKRQFAADLARSAMLQRQGYIVLRFTAVHIFQQQEWLLDTVRRALSGRA